MIVSDQRWRALKARNLNLPGVAPERPSIPVKLRPQQLPCDIGLFSDDANQLDLVEMCQQPTNEE